MLDNVTGVKAKAEATSMEPMTKTNFIEVTIVTIKYGADLSSVIINFFQG